MWLADVLLWGSRVRQCLLRCEISSNRVGILARNIGYRMRRYHGVLPTGLVLAWCGITSAHRMGRAGARKFMGYFMDGALVRYRRLPCRAEIERMLTISEVVPTVLT